MKQREVRLTTARIYVPPEAFGEGCVALAGEALHHVRTVLRLRVGDEFRVTDGIGGEYRVRLGPGGQGAAATILERTEPRRESPLRVTLAQSVPKGDRFPFVLQKSVELGVSAIIPVVSRRTVVVPTVEDAPCARWRRIIEAAVAQSGRTALPELRPPCGWEELLAAGGDEHLKILLWEKERRGLGEILAARPGLGSLLVAVGPEGGWSEEEVERGRQAGFVTGRIGPRILRTETAGLAALAVVQFVYGDLGC